jgi:hypothetical protein
MEKNSEQSNWRLKRVAFFQTMHQSLTGLQKLIEYGKLLYCRLPL